MNLLEAKEYLIKNGYKLKRLNECGGIGGSDMGAWGGGGCGSWSSYSSSCGGSSGTYGCGGGSSRGTYLGCGHYADDDEDEDEDYIIGGCGNRDVYLGCGHYGTPRRRSSVCGFSPRRRDDNEDSAITAAASRRNYVKNGWSDFYGCYTYKNKATGKIIYNPNIIGSKKFDKIRTLAAAFKTEPKIIINMIELMVQKFRIDRQTAFDFISKEKSLPIGLITPTLEYIY